MKIWEGKEKQNEMKTKRHTNHKRLLTMENKLRVAGRGRVGVWGNWVTESKERT